MSFRYWKDIQKILTLIEKLAVPNCCLKAVGFGCDDRNNQLNDLNKTLHRMWFLRLVCISKIHHWRGVYSKKS